MFLTHFLSFVVSFFSDEKENINTFWVMAPKLGTSSSLTDKIRKRRTRKNHTLWWEFPLFNDYEGISWFFIGSKACKFLVTKLTQLEPVHRSVALPLPFSYFPQGQSTLKFFLKPPALSTLTMLSTSCFIKKISSQQEHLQTSTPSTDKLSCIWVIWVYSLLLPFCPSSRGVPFSRLRLVPLYAILCPFSPQGPCLSNMFLSSCQALPLYRLFPLNIEICSFFSFKNRHTNKTMPSWAPHFLLVAATASQLLVTA